MTITIILLITLIILASTLALKERILNQTKKELHAAEALKYSHERRAELYSERLSKLEQSNQKLIENLKKLSIEKEETSKLLLRQTNRVDELQVRFDVANRVIERNIIKAGPAHYIYDKAGSKKRLYLTTRISYEVGIYNAGKKKDKALKTFKTQKDALAYLEKNKYTGGLVWDINKGEAVYRSYDSIPAPEGTLGSYDEMPLAA